MFLTQEDYEKALDSLEVKLEKHLEDVLSDSFDKSVKAEQYITALCLSREYLKEKIENIKTSNFCETCNLSQESKTVWEVKK